MVRLLVHRTTGVSALVAAVIGAMTAIIVTSTMSAGAQPHDSPAPPTSADQTLLYRAEQAAIENCLRDKGFRYWPEPRSPAAVSDLFPYVVDNVAWAQAHGFGGRQSVQEQTQAASDPNVRYVAGLAAPRRQALADAENGNGPSDPGVVVTLPTGQVMGHSVRGCVATAEDHLYGSFPAWFRASNAVAALPSLWQAQVVGDRRYVAAVSRWADCMRGRHQPYASPQEAADHFATAGTTPESDADFTQEVSAATAEALCAESTGLGNLARQLDTYYQNRVDAHYSALLTTYRHLVTEALPRAQSLLRG